MAKGTGALTLSNIRSSNLLVTVLVLVIVLALFFIPELIDFQKYIEGKESEVKAPAAVLSEQVAKESVNASNIASASGISPLGQVLALVQREDPSEIMLETDRHIKADISWSDLRGKRALGELRKARTSIRHFEKRLNRNYKNTKEALAMLSEAVERLINDRAIENKMSAEAAYSMVEELVVNVTDALTLDGAVRADLIDWSSVKLLSILNDSQAAQFRDAAVPPFNPQPRLISFELLPLIRDGRLESVAMQRLRLSVVGREVKFVTFVSDRGSRVAKVRPSRPDHLGRRIARGPVVMKGNGPILVLVTDSMGETFEKSYEFYPRAKVFGLQRPGVKRLPFSGGYQSERLDSFFALGPGKPVIAGGVPSVNAAESAQQGPQSNYQKF